MSGDKGKRLPSGEIDKGNSKLFVLYAAYFVMQCAAIFCKKAKAPVTYGQPQSYGQPLEYRPPQMHEQTSGYGYPGQANAVTTQGNVSYVSPNTVIVTSGVRPPNGMVIAILACVFCFWPTGVFAIMYASQANSELDNNVAWSKYRTSRTLSIVSIIVGLIWIAIAIWRIVYAVTYTSQYYSQTFKG